MTGSGKLRVTTPASVLVLFVALGCWANLAQIMVLRLLVGTFYGTELIVSLVLAGWLAGVAAGAFMGSRWPAPLGVLTGAAVLAGPAALGLFRLALVWLPAPQGGCLPILPLLGLAIVCSAPVTVILGMALPAGARRGNVQTIYSVEALGGFFGGLFFAFFIAGRAGPPTLAAALPLFPLSAALVRWPRNWLVRGLVLAAPLLAVASAPLGQAFAQAVWTWAHPGYELVETRDTPYQQLQIARYYDQKSLYSDNALLTSWPDPAQGEETAHLFASQVGTPSRFLILGAPAPDIAAELRKYPDSRIDVVELDPGLQRIIASAVREIAPPRGATRQGEVTFIDADPRRFLTAATATYDGILIAPSDPTTLLANRLFTREAFAAMALRLRAGGTLMMSLTGNENYLGAEMEQVLHSTWQTLRQVFPRVAALPGYPLVFLAGPADTALATAAETLGVRFAGRGIPTQMFTAAGFRNRLQPFRQRELDTWLARVVPTTPNTDARPTAFHYQLRLWDVFTGSGLRRILAWDAPTWALVLGLPLLAWLLALAVTRKFEIQCMSIAAGGTIAWSGAVGMVTELCLLFAFQSRQGAMFQLAALFFGLYMLGLAAGAASAGRWFAADRRTVLRVKGANLAGLLGILALLATVELHTLVPIGAAITVLAWLAGLEFALVARALEERGLASPRVAGLLFWTDHLGAFVAAVVATPVLLPLFGLTGAMGILIAVVAVNLGALWAVWPDTTESV